MTGRLAAAALLLLVFSSSLATADPRDMKLYDDFDGQDFSPSGGLYFKDTAEQRAGKVEFQSEVKRTGTGALKLSVHPRCAPSGEDCSERAEIWEKTALRVPYDKAVWYGFAVKFADPIPQDDHRYLIAQWKREIDPGAPGDFSPFLAIRMRKGKLFVTVETNFHPPVSSQASGLPAPCGGNLTPVWLRPDTNQMRALVAADDNWTAADGREFKACTDKIAVIDRGNPLPSPDSGWIDFAVMTRPGPDGSGHIELFANGKWIRTIKGHIGHDDPPLGKNQYFKFGPYRAPGKTEWTLYFDHFRRGPDCRDVLGDEAACRLIR
jgi:hypothetical protein